MVEMRTNINNALTTVLGNAELLEQEPGLPISVQLHAHAIRSMAMRLHEIFCRFSSLEKEPSAGIVISIREGRAQLLAGNEEKTGVQKAFGRNCVRHANQKMEFKP
jgi:hypothetical protein